MIGKTLRSAKDLFDELKELKRLGVDLDRTELLIEIEDGNGEYGEGLRVEIDEAIDGGDVLTIRPVVS